MAIAQGRRRRAGLTIVELLIVAAIIALLAAAIFPAAAAVRHRVNAARCQANVRNLALALLTYAGEHGNRFPLNVRGPSPGRYWYDPQRIGGYVPRDDKLPFGKVGGRTFACPSDPEGHRSYAMNLWASSAIDGDSLAARPPRGRLWDRRAPDAARLILVAEAWSTTGSADIGYYAPATVGYLGDTAGQRFGGGGGVTPFNGGPRLGQLNCELPYARHRDARGRGKDAQPFGRVHIGYADGHVELHGDGDLVDANSGEATGNSLWSPLDLPAAASAARAAR